MDALAQTLARSPELFPHSLERDTVSFIRLTEAEYRRAAFLDARILSPTKPTQQISFAQVAAATDESGMPESCNFIFHISHVGSTLLSRLLGQHPGIFSLREPAILRTLAQDERLKATLPVFLKLWSRTFAAGQRALVKTTSIVSELAVEMLARPYQPKAIFMFVPAPTYLASILAGPNSRQESRMLAPARLARLHRRLGRNVWTLPAMSDGESVAMNWACEMTALTAAANARVHWLNFDRFLAEPAVLLAASFRHLGTEASADQIRAILASPDMRTYSKAQEYAYDAKLRSQLLNQANAEHSGEIDRGLAWLEQAAKEFPAIGEALRLA
jgi:hypothetical protein